MRKTTTTATLLLAAAVAGCDPHDPTPPRTPADVEAAQAVVETATEGFDRPARIVLGSWSAMSEADGEWSVRLAGGMRSVAEEAYRRSPHAPLLLRITGSGNHPSSAVWGGWVSIMVIDKENLTYAQCCSIYHVDVRLDGGSWKVRREIDIAGIGHPSSLDRLVEETEALEMRFRDENTSK